MKVCLSSKSVEALDHFAKQSGPLTDTVVKCVSLVNSAAWEKTLASLKADFKFDVRVDGPINLHSIRIATKGDLIRVW